MNIVIVDDEHLARDRLRRMLAQLDGHQVIGEAANGIEAVALVDRLQPDLVLLDIRMPGMDGLETARHFLNAHAPPAVVFCTAYEEHALDAFELQAVGYLLKPVRKEKLSAAMDQARRLNKLQLAALTDQDGERRSHISAKTRQGIELVPVADIRYFQADQKYVTVRHGSGEVIIDEPLRELEMEFQNLFVRIHRNALAGVQHIEGLEKTSTGAIQIRLHGVVDRLDISRRHLPSVRKMIRTL